MKWALINPRWSFEGGIYFGCREPHLPLEYGYSRDLLRKQGHDVQLIDAQMFQLDENHVREQLAKFAPDFTSCSRT